MITGFLSGLIEGVGATVIRVVERFGSFAEVAGRGTWSLFTPPYRPRLVLQQLEFVGVQSLSIVLISGFFTGGVFALQAAYGFGLFGAETLTGSTVTLSLSRSLGPVFCSLMVTGRAGSAMAAEIGTMKVTEQIDALEAMAVDPVEYLVSPRVLAGALMVPVLSAMYTGIGMLGAYMVSVPYMGIDGGAFLDRIAWYADPEDLHWGLVKASVYGWVLAAVGCWKGLSVRGGAQGVGQATTQAVVVSSVAILVLDYFFTDLLMKLGLLT